MEIIDCILQPNFAKYDELSYRFQKVWLKRGIYLVMERVRILLWRNLIKRLSMIYGARIDVQLIQKAVKLQGGSEDINECICIVANLIYEGYVKGYIFQNQTKRCLVLKNQGAFPKLINIAN